MFVARKGKICIPVGPYRAFLQLKVLSFAIALSFLITAIGLSPCFAVDTGDVSPQFSLAQRGGGTLSLADYKGKVVYLDFWASWCGPCRESFPWINDLKEKYKTEDFEVIAVNVDLEQANADDFIKEVGASFPVVYDPKQQTPEDYKLKAMPSSFLIGKDGKIVSSFKGFEEEGKKELERQLQELLGE